MFLCLEMVRSSLIYYYNEMLIAIRTSYSKKVKAVLRVQSWRQDVESFLLKLVSPWTKFERL